MDDHMMDIGILNRYVPHFTIDASIQLIEGSNQQFGVSLNSVGATLNGPLGGHAGPFCASCPVGQWGSSTHIAVERSTILDGIH